MIGKLEKLETCIRLADKMDNMDRTWRWFINPFFRMCKSKVKDLLEFVNHENSKVRIVMRNSFNVVYCQLTSHCNQSLQSLVIGRVTQSLRFKLEV